MPRPTSISVSLPVCASAAPGEFFVTETEVAVPIPLLAGGFVATTTVAGVPVLADDVWAGDEVTGGTVAAGVVGFDETPVLVEGFGHGADGETEGGVEWAGAEGCERWVLGAPFGAVDTGEAE